MRTKKDYLYEIVETKKDVYLLSTITDDNEELYSVTDNTMLIDAADGCKRFRDDVEEHNINFFQEDEQENAQLLYEQQVLYKERTATSNEILQQAYKEFEERLLDVQQNVGGADWRDMLDKETFVKQRLQELEKDAAIQKANTYINPKVYEKTVPFCLRDKSLFVGWKYVWSERNERLIKLPINPRNGRAASTAEYTTWSTFERTCDRINKDKLHGLGIMFNGRGIMGIDIDDCIEDGKLNDKAREIVELVNSYTELSPSGKGIHILCYGNIPPGYGYKRKDDLEMYDSDRFFTLTGQCLDNVFRKIPPRSVTQPAIDKIWNKYLKKEQPAKRAMSEVENMLTIDDDALLQKVYSSKRGKDFKRMYELGMAPTDEKGEIAAPFRKDAQNTSDLDNVNWSQVDFSFCGILAFYNPPKTQVDRIFRNSKLMRPKWNQNRGGKTYGEMTIDRAYETRISVYAPATYAAEKKIMQHIKSKDNIDEM